MASIPIDPDIVVVVDDVVGDGEVGDVPVHGHRFAVAGPEVVDLIAADRNAIERGRRRRSVHGNAKSVAGRFGCGHDVMHGVVQDLNVAAGAGNPDAGRRRRRAGSLEIADLKTLDRNVTLVGDVEQALRIRSRRRKPCPIHDCGLAWVTLQGDWPCRG